MVKGGVMKRLDQLQFGDVVQDTPTSWSTYYFDKAWDHRETANQTYISLTTENGFKIKWKNQPMHKVEFSESATESDENTYLDLIFT